MSEFTAEDDGITSLEGCAQKCKELNVESGAWSDLYASCYCNFVPASEMCREPCVDESYIDLVWSVSRASIGVSAKSVCDVDWYYNEAYCIDEVGLWRKLAMSG